MYLFIWSSGEARQFRENLTTVDYLAAKQGLIRIVRFDAEKGFLRLHFDLEKICWVPIPLGKTLAADGTRVHSL